METAICLPKSCRELNSILIMLLSDRLNFKDPCLSGSIINSKYNVIQEDDDLHQKLEESIVVLSGNLE